MSFLDWPYQSGKHIKFHHVQLVPTLNCAPPETTDISQPSTFSTELGHRDKWGCSAHRSQRVQPRGGFYAGCIVSMGLSFDPIIPKFAREESDTLTWWIQSRPFVYPYQEHVLQDEERLLWPWWPWFDFTAALHSIGSGSWYVSV